MTDLDTLQAQLHQAFRRRDWLLTRRLAGHLLQRVPAHADAHYQGGVAWLETGQLAKALTHLHVAARLTQGRADVLGTFAHALAEAGLSREAAAAAGDALKREPDDPRLLQTLATVLTRCGQHERAAGAYARAVQLQPEDAELRHNHALSLMFAGDFERAYAEVTACLQRDPHCWKAYGTRAQLATDQQADTRAAQLTRLLHEHSHDAGAVEALNMALTHELERLGRHRDAFAALTVAKHRRRQRLSYRIEDDRALFAALADHAPDRADVHSGPVGSEAIFVLGMPRTGTTLVDRILSCHPAVESAGELHQFSTALKRLSGSRTPSLLDADTVACAQRLDWATLGAEYLRTSRVGGNQRPRFVDKQPHNFLYAGHIANALPGAPIICLRRHPMDTCLSNFRQAFGERSPFHGYALDLLDTGRYYLLFDQLMKQWQSAYPGRILEVSYERLVAEQEAVTREILVFCGLDWHPDCLTFERNAAPVSTASAVQVRAPMNARSVGRWRQLENELQPLRELLEAGGVRIDD